MGISPDACGVTTTGDGPRGEATRSHPGAPPRPEAKTFAVSARGKTGPNQKDTLPPEATRPDLRGRTARPLTDLFSPTSSAMFGSRVNGLTMITVVGMCNVEGSTAHIPRESAVDQPPGLNELWLRLRLWTCGTSRGSWMLTVWGETAHIPGEAAVSRPPGRCTLIVRGHPNMMMNILFSLCFRTFCLHYVSPEF